jgi:hypothetical protein
MKKLLVVFALVAMLSAGTGVVGASDTELKNETQISDIDSSFSISTLNKRPVAMD